MALDVREILEQAADWEGTTDTLLDQHAQMHAADPNVFAGFSVMRHIKRIKALIDATGAKTLLDYGCGKGRQYTTPFEVDGKRYESLAAYWGVNVTLYDPCVPGIDKLNETLRGHDVVICTDVLEHIPEADVADEIAVIASLADKGVFLSISCVPAKKVLPDGRNCHATVKPVEWWRDLVGKVFTEAGITAGGAAYAGEGGQEHFDSTFGEPGPWAPSGKQPLHVATKNCVPDETISENVRKAIEFGFPHFERCAPTDVGAVLVSGGPSFTNFLPKIRALAAAGCPVFCVKSSHDTLISHGIVPLGCFLLDPRPMVLDFVAEPHPDVNYIIATMVHASTFERMRERNAKVWVYHAKVGAAGEDELFKTGGVVVSGGSTAATRGMVIMEGMGFREIHAFGFDSAYGARNALKDSYTGAHFDKDRMTVEVEGRRYETDPQLVAQGQDLQFILNQMPHVDFTFYGTGLGQTTVRAMQAKVKALPDWREIYA